MIVIVAVYTFAQMGKGETMSDIKKSDAYWIVKPIFDGKGFQIGHEVIKSIPSADVAPVRHGRWEKNDYLFIDTLYRCSVCGEEFYLENGTPQENQYYHCPCCGSKMDGGDDDEKRQV